MKINMWKLLLAVLIASAALVGCKDERNNFMVDDTVAFIKDKTFMTVSMYNERCELPVIKAGKGQAGATVRVEASAEALAAYNEANGTEYIAVPESAVQYTKMLKFSEGDIRQMVNVTWVDTDISNLGVGKYAVALKISVDNDALEIPEDRQVMVVSLEESNIGMGAEVAPVFGPAASRETAIYEGPVTIDNPISVLDVTVNYEIDNSLIADYNAANGTSYVALSSDMVSLAAPSSVLEAGAAATSFSLQLASEKLFNGNELKAVDKNQYLVPVRIKSLSNEAIPVGISVMYVPVSFNMELKGPWELLEGENNCYGKDPNAPGWALQYVASRLFDGVTGPGGEWISSWDNGPIEFPMVFVADLGVERVFTNFRISDFITHQGQYRDYELYTATEYKEESTAWTLVAKGVRGYSWAAAPPPYDFPVQKMIPGRYLKFMIMKPEFSTTSVDYLNGRGKLADVQGEGF